MHLKLQSVYHKNACICRTQDNKLFEEFRHDRFSLTACVMISKENHLYQKYCSLLVLISTFALMI